MADSPQPPHNDTIFGRILRGEIPCDQVYADEHCLAFRDVAPQAPVHILVIPREPVVNLAEAGDQHQQLLGHLLLVAAWTKRPKNCSVDSLAFPCPIHPIIQTPLDQRLDRAEPPLQKKRNLEV